MRIWHDMRRLLMGIILDSPLEKSVRRIYSFVSVTGSTKYDRETLKVMRKVLSETSNCIDIGAYRGEILRQMLAICHRGEVYAFEAVPENCRYLVENYSDANVINIALSDSVGQAKFYKSTGRPARSGLRKQNYPDPSEAVEEIVVEVGTLDESIPADEQIHLIKIDVEGGELNVMKGGRGLIQRCSPVIVFEFSQDYASVYGYTATDLHDFVVNQCDMKISTMHRWLDGKDSFSQSEFLECVDQGLDFYFMAYK